MSLRKLPDIQIAAPKAEISFDLAPEAVASWGEITAATDDDVITIFDPIGATPDGRGVTANRISAALRSIGNKPVTVQINSPGGSPFDGLAIYNLLRAHPKQITVQIVGIAASAASIIAMAGDEIEIGASSLLMVHNAQWVAIGDRHAMQEAHDTMEVIDNALIGLYVDRTARDAAEIAAMMDATTFMTGKDAVEKSFATRLLEADQTPTAMKAEADLPALYRLEAALTRLGASRAERRSLIKEIAAGMPSAAAETAKPGAGDPAVDDGSIGLSLALTRLKLTRP